MVDHILLEIKVGNPLRDGGVGLKDTISLLEALVRGFSKACPLEPGAGGPEVVDAWRRYDMRLRFFFHVRGKLCTVCRSKWVYFSIHADNNVARMGTLVSYESSGAASPRDYRVQQKARGVALLFSPA